MNIPPAETIEEAVSSLNSLTDFVKKDQLKELHSAVGDKSQDFQDGYTLGLQVARRAIASSVAIAMANVKPEDVL